MKRYLHSKKTLFLFFCIFFSLSLIFSFSYADKNEDFKLIKGKGKPPQKSGLTQVQKSLMARRAALVDAYRNALLYYKKYEKIKWEIKPYQTIHVSGRIKGAKIVKTLFKEDGSVEVTLRIPAKKGG